MTNKRKRGLTRREFGKLTGAGALAAGVGANFLFPARAAAQIPKPITLELGE